LTFYDLQIAFSNFTEIVQRVYFKSPYTLGWIHAWNVTAYRNTVSWRCGRDSCPRNVSKVGYAVTLRAFSVYCRYLIVSSKGWYGYGRSRCGRATSRCTSTPYDTLSWTGGNFNADI